MTASLTTRVLLATAIAVGLPPCAGVGPRPPAPAPAHVGPVRVESPREPALVPEGERVYSPSRTRWYRVAVAPGNVPYEQRVGRVQVAGAGGFARTVVFEGFKSYRARWVSEKLLYLQVWHGRVYATEHIVDLESSRLVYQDEAVHPTDSE